MSTKLLKEISSAVITKENFSFHKLNNRMRGRLVKSKTKKKYKETECPGYCILEDSVKLFLLHYGWDYVFMKRDFLWLLSYDYKGYFENFQVCLCLLYLMSPSIPVLTIVREEDLPTINPYDCPHSKLLYGGRCCLY